jgi:biotin operon repressor
VPAFTHERGSMSPSLKKLAVVLGAVGAIAVAGCGGSSSSTQSGSTSSSSSAAATGQQAPDGMDLTTLASKLGVSKSKLQQAMDKLRSQQGSSSSPTDMAAALAKELGLSEAKVQSALQATRPSGTPPQGTPPSGTPPQGTQAQSGTTQSS